MKSSNEQLKLIRWGIIGCGSVTEIKSGPPYYKVDGFELAAVMRRDEIKVIDYANRHGVKKYYTNAVDLIEDPEIDAIYIATPPDSHKYYGLKVAAAGKPCCIEKPLAPCYKDSMEIHEAFEKSGVPLFVAYYRRSLPRFKQVKDWIDNGNIGEIRHIDWHLSKPANSLDVSKNYNWRTDKLIADGGYFDDLASHGLDLFVFLLGNVKTAHGISLNQQGLYSSKDAISACWLHENGVTGAGSWNFGSNIREDKVEIYGSKGKIEFSVFDEAPLVLNSSIQQQNVLIENPRNIQFYHVKNIRDQLYENKAHPSTGLSATHTSWVMDKILSKI
ncbi:Gfo/Idh/MocA family protein [Lutibacter flavus]|uniref:Predicted dehydrogenase n=1 Tax=Lutibacter flavus TaxID=691689 RepID=A0A238YTV5_9FLAO|nr:Gfo/Idh/MocA family oxidoreductase [Lutibacter flavus]SNR74577.1 Predicted dehydrogenase [Lutibacter flavus]